MDQHNHQRLSQAECWDLGVRHRETLLQVYMERNRLKHRPFLKNVIDDLLEDVQGVRLREEVLPLDTYARTEFVAGRVEVSINSRISEIPGVKDSRGVAHVAKWHESIHVEHDRPLEQLRPRGLQDSLPGFTSEFPGIVVCRSDL
ncbi:MAG: hypothetical protein QGI09_11220, partial [Dehalococcoidia bacterium]|nr:hypothetical protein [Dehalococcoidia bacterium]